jgi:hypothetical protein
MRGVLSFAVALFATLVLLYFAASTVSISEYHAAAQKQLQVQVLSQAYGDAAAAYDDAVVDAVLDSAYASGKAAPCNAAASGTIPEGLSARAQLYISRATANLSAALNDTAYVSSSWDASGLSTDSTQGQQALSPSCANGESLVLDRVVAAVAFPLNVTSADGATGALSRRFNRTYDVLANYSVASNSFTVLVRRDGSELRCVSVAC